MLTALVLAGIVAVAIAITTFGSLRTHKRETDAANRVLNRYKSQTDRKVAEAHTAGVEAGKAAADAQVAIQQSKVEIAEAHARAAEADARAQQAGLDLEKTRFKLNELQTVVPYKPEMLEALKSEISQISPKSNKVFIESETNNVEAEHRGYQLAQLFKSVGYENWLGTGVDSAMRDPADHGEVVISNYEESTDAEATKIGAAFQKAGFHTSVRRASLSANRNVAEYQRMTIRVFVLKRDHGEF